jgi:hypothetical protein
MKNFRYLDGLFVILALGAGGLAIWIDSHATEPQPAAGTILIAAGLLGLLRPGLAWLWALILGVSLFAGYSLFPALRLQPSSPPEPGPYAALIALIPAFIGAYAGVLFNKLISAGKGSIR